jgi:hypothetical protein
MATYNTDGKHGLRALEGSNAVSDIDEGFEALRDDIDSIIATDDQGPFASRPVSTPANPGKAGRYYFATDRGDGGLLYRDYGTGWIPIGPRRIVSGQVSAAGTLVSGTGFSVVRTGTGIYAITFTPAFADHPPTVTATAIVGDQFARLGSVSTGGVGVAIVNPGAGFANTGFHFNAVASW